MGLCVARGARCQCNRTQNPTPARHENGPVPQGHQQGNSEKCPLCPTSLTQDEAKKQQPSQDQALEGPPGQEADTSCGASALQGFGFWASEIMGSGFGV